MEDSRFINPDYARRTKVWMIVAAHKQFRMPEDRMYIPMHVGAAGAVNEDGEDIRFGYQTDNTGDNISGLNPEFCELTGLYWAWKNLNSDYIGLVHYRRYFRGLGKKKTGKGPFDNILTYRQLRPLLGKYKVIVPQKRRYYIETLRQHYEHNHYIRELDTAKEVMLEKYPEYKDAYDKAINRTWGYMFNMMILDRKLMDDYCSWLFDILFELVKRFDAECGEERSDFENRYPGRVAERLFNVWLEHQLESGVISKDDIKEIPFMYMEKINIVKKGFTFLSAKFIGRKPKKSF